MASTVILFLVGIVFLIKGGDWFVDGATKIARRFGIPELIIGATVVSIGTTLPEVMVSATSAIGGAGDIAYGNAIGSIICNTSLIAALTIAIRPSHAERKTLVMPIVFFFVSAVVYSYIAYFEGYFSRASGFVLLGIFAVYVIANVLKVKSCVSLANDEETAQRESIRRPVVFLVFGAVVIAVGARFVVDNGIIIAEALGVPQTVIALTFVALGTSLPELVTAITSLVKGHGALSLGNIIGANLFNLVLVSGVSVSLSPFKVPDGAMLFGRNASLVMDIPLMFAVMLLLTVPALLKEKLYRAQGIVLLLMYAAFCAVQFSM